MWLEYVLPRSGSTLIKTRETSSLPPCQDPVKCLFFFFLTAIPKRRKKPRKKTDIFGGGPLFLFFVFFLNSHSSSKVQTRFWRNATVNPSVFQETGTACIHLKYVPIFFFFFPSHNFATKPDKRIYVNVHLADYFGNSTGSLQPN